MFLKQKRVKFFNLALFLFNVEKQFYISLIIISRNFISDYTSGLEKFVFFSLFENGFIE